MDDAQSNCSLGSAVSVSEQETLNYVGAKVYAGHAISDTELYTNLVQNVALFAVLFAIIFSLKPRSADE